LYTNRQLTYTNPPPIPDYTPLSWIKRTVNVQLTGN